MKELNESNIESTLLTDKLVVIDFWAEWCGPCRMVAPIMEQLSTEYGDKAIITKCDVDTNSEMTVKYGIRNIPTILFIRNGEVVDKLVGAHPKEKFVEKINSL